MPERHPKSYLALSAVPGLLPEDAQVATEIERELRRIDRARSPIRRRRRVDRLIDLVWRSAA